MNKEKQNKESTDSVVVSSSFHRKFVRIQPKYLIVAGLLLVTGAGAYFVLGKDKPKKVTPTTSQTTDGSNSEYTKQLSNDVIAAQKTVDDAAKAAANSGGSALSPEQVKTQKDTLANNYVELGDAFYNSDKPKDAIVAYNNALKTSDSAKREALRGLLYAYSANNQFPEAIKAGEDLIAFLQPLVKDDVYIGARIKAYQADVDRLKSGQQL